MKFRLSTFMLFFIGLLVHTSVSSQEVATNSLGITHTSIVWKNTSASLDNTLKISPNFMLEDENPEIDLKKKRMKIAGLSILAGLGGASLGTTIWGRVKANKNNEDFREEYKDDGTGSSIFLTGLVGTGISLTASMPLIIKGFKKK